MAIDLKKMKKAGSTSTQKRVEKPNVRSFKVPNVSIYTPSRDIFDLIGKRLSEESRESMSKFTARAYTDRALKEGLITKQEVEDLK